MLAALLAAPLPLTAAPAWELVTDNGRIVLLGSVHFLRADDHPLPAVIDAEYARAETIVLELDLDDIDELEIQQLARQLGTSPEYTGLTAALGAENFEAAQALALGIGINLRLLEPLEPWLAAITITSLRLVQLGYEPAHGVESYLVRQAARDSKEIIGLETAADQFYALDGLPAPEQTRFLLTTLSEASDAGQDMDSLVDAWRQADADALAGELSTGLDEQPNLYDEIVVRRNRAWTEQIAKLAQSSGDYLIVVGALHLIGADSLVHMLSQRGLTATKLPVPGTSPGNSD